MIYKKYGKTFKTLRRQKCLSLTDFESVNISASTISKFERGDTMISFDKLLQSLDVLGTSLEEFELLLNGNNLSGPIFLVQEIDQAIMEKNSNKLLLLTEKCLRDGFSYIALCAKSSIQQLDDTEIEKMTNYFFSLEAWLSSDLWMLSIVLPSLEIHDSLHILDDLLQSEDGLLISSSYHYYFVRALCQSSHHLTSLGYKDYSMHILNHIKELKLINFSVPSFILLQFFYKLSFAFWVARFEDFTMGKEEIEKCLTIFSELGLDSLSNYFSTWYITLKTYSKT